MKLKVLLAGGHVIDLDVDDANVQTVRNDIASGKPGVVSIVYPDHWVDIVRSQVVAVTPVR